MAFIVEMFHGRSGKIEIMDLDNEGELYIKEVVMAGKPDPDYRYFSCSGTNWTNVLELGNKMGWKPSGSVLAKTIDTPNPIFNDYKPSDWGDEQLKVFMEDDASALAEALEKSIILMDESQLKDHGREGPIIITPAMNPDEYNQVNQGFSKFFLLDFIKFLRKGRFFFVWDD